MDSKVSILLEAYGLDEKEIKMYLSLVGKVELNAYELAKLTGIHRSTTYDILERLISKGFVSRIQKGEKTFYSAVELSQTISKIKEKESLLLSLIPEFEKLKEGGASRVRVFENKESQKQFNFNLFNQINSGRIKEICILDGGPSKEDDLSSQIFMESLIKEIKKKKLNKKIEFKGIWNTKFKKTNILQLFSGIGENKFLDKIPTFATIVIFGEYLAYLFTMNETPQVIEIQNKLIAEENKTYFSYLWKSAKK